MIRLTTTKAKVVKMLFNTPFTADSVSGLEDAYHEALVAIGDKGFLTKQFMIDLDRVFAKGLYTLKFRLSMYVDNETTIDVGEIIDVKLSRGELRLDLVDENTNYSMVFPVSE